MATVRRARARAPTAKSRDDAIRHAAPLSGEVASACTRTGRGLGTFSHGAANLCLPDDVSPTQVTSRSQLADQGRPQRLDHGTLGGVYEPCAAWREEGERAREGGMQRCPFVMRAPRSLASLFLPVAVVQARPPQNQTCSG